MPEDGQTAVLFGDDCSKNRDDFQLAAAGFDLFGVDVIIGVALLPPGPRVLCHIREPRPIFFGQSLAGWILSANHPQAAQHGPLVVRRYVVGGSGDRNANISDLRNTGQTSRSWAILGQKMGVLRRGSATGGDGGIPGNHSTIAAQGPDVSLVWRR